MNNHEEMALSLGNQAQKAARMLRTAGSDAKNLALLTMARALVNSRDAIRSANQIDIDAAVAGGMTGPKLDRLRLSDRVLDDLVTGLEQVASMPDPVSAIENMEVRPNGLKVGRMRIPLGVVGMIFESRPNVTVEAGALTMKAGNAVILRGGSEAFASNRCLADLFRQALATAGLPEDAVQLVPTTDREAIVALCHLEDHIDAMIPRGGDGLIRFVTDHARMPVLKHYKGVCHLFVDRTADMDMATSITVNSKTQRPGVCNALETLLVDAKIAGEWLPRAEKALASAGVTLRGCERTRELVPTAEPATDEDWAAEYLDLILAVRVVDDMDMALDHIARWGTRHTDAIVTSDHANAMRFVDSVDSSLVAVNASTRFNDGFQLGLGAEIGISTSKLHAFGPMGLKELTTTKFVAFGNGQVRT